MDYEYIFYFEHTKPNKYSIQWHTHLRGFKIDTKESIYDNILYTTLDETENSPRIILINKTSDIILDSLGVEGPQFSTSVFLIRRNIDNYPIISRTDLLSGVKFDEKVSNYDPLLLSDGPSWLSFRHLYQVPDGPTGEVIISRSVGGGIWNSSSTQRPLGIPKKIDRIDRDSILYSTFSSQSSSLIWKNDDEDSNHIVFKSNYPFLFSYSEKSEKIIILDRDNRIFLANKPLALKTSIEKIDPFEFSQIFTRVEDEYVDIEWSPTLNEVSFTRKRDDLYQVGIWNLSNHQETVLYESPDKIGRPQWSVPGHFVMFGVKAGESDNKDLYQISVADKRNGAVREIPEIEPVFDYLWSIVPL